MHFFTFVCFFCSLTALSLCQSPASPASAVPVPSAPAPGARQVEPLPSLSQEKPKLNVLEVLKGMGQAIQLLISQHKHQGGSRSDLESSETKEKYREQAEKLRAEINRRSGQLQKVVSAAIEALKDRGDVVVRRILENLNTRLGQAKLRADKILGEPESSELAVRTLNTINQGLSNLNSLVQHVLSRVNVSINVDVKDTLGSAPAFSLSSPVRHAPTLSIRPLLSVPVAAQPVPAVAAAAPAPPVPSNTEVKLPVGEVVQVGEVKPVVASS